MKPYTNLRSIVLTAALSLPIPALANPPIIVTASRLAEDAGRSLSPVTIINREDIERNGQQDIAQLLRMHAGLDIGRTGGPGQQTSLFLRGTDSNHTLVLLDGVRINPGTIGGAPLQYIDPEIIERVEIVRGSHSTIYGSDAIGGVIQLFTRRPDDNQLHISSVLGTGADNTHQAGVQIANSHGFTAYSLDIQHRNSNGFPTRTTSDIDSGHDNTTVNAHIDFSTDSTEIGLSHWQSRGTTDYLDFFLAPLSQDYSNSVTAIDFQPNLAGRWTPALRLSRMEDEIQQNDNDDFVRTRRNIIDWQNDFELSDNHLLSAGIYLLREDTDSLSFGTAFDEDTDVDAVYLQDRMTYDTHSVRISARYTDHEGFGDHVTWGLSYGLETTNDSFIYASTATAFRAPDATDRFGCGGNPSLDPEESLNIELGMRKQLSAGQTASVSIFQNEIDDLIVFNDPDGFSGPIVGMNQNIDEARIRGVEFGYRATRGAYSAQIEGILQNPRNRTLGKQLARRAKRTLTTALNYSADNYSVGASYILTSKRPDSDFNTTMLGGYGLLNLTFSRSLGKSVTLEGKLENALDKQYALADRFNTQDRAAYLSLRFTN